MAFIEAALDDPEHISTEGFSEKLLARVNEIWTICSNCYPHLKMDV